MIKSCQIQTHTKYGRKRKLNFENDSPLQKKRKLNPINESNTITKMSVDRDESEDSDLESSSSESCYTIMKNNLEAVIKEKHPLKKNYGLGFVHQSLCLDDDIYLYILQKKNHLKLHFEKNDNLIYGYLRSCKTKIIPKDIFNLIWELQYDFDITLCRLINGEEKKKNIYELVKFQYFTSLSDIEIYLEDYFNKFGVLEKLFPKPVIRIKDESYTFKNFNKISIILYPLNKNIYDQFLKISNCSFHDFMYAKRDALEYQFPQDLDWYQKRDPQEMKSFLKELYNLKILDLLKITIGFGYDRYSGTAEYYIDIRYLNYYNGNFLCYDNGHNCQTPNDFDRINFVIRNRYLSD